MSKKNNPPDLPISSFDTECKSSQEKNKNSGFGRDLTSGSIPKHVIFFSVPMLIGSLLQTAYGFINAIWVGQFLGTSALAAVTVSFPVIFVMIALGNGLTIASNILISQNYGAKRFEALKKIVDTSCLLIFFLSLFLLLLGEIFAPFILKTMGTPSDVMPLAASYLRIFLFSIPLTFGLFLIRSFMQGIGDSKTPLYFQFAAILISIILDPIFMFGWLGFPKLGLNGTAYSTVVSQALALISLIYFLRKKKNLVSPLEKGWEFDSTTAWLTFKIGIPSALQQSVVSIGMLFVTSIVNSFGEAATAAFGVASRIDQLAFMPAMTFSMAISTLTGQNIGAKKFERVNEIFFWGCMLSGGFTLFSSLIALSIPHFLMKIFTNDLTVINLGVTYLYSVAGFYIFFAIMFISNGIINGAGHTFLTTIISLFSLWIVRVPLAYYLSSYLQDVKGVWYSISISFFFSMVISLIYYKLEIWKKPGTLSSFLSVLSLRKKKI